MVGNPRRKRRKHSRRSHRRSSRRGLKLWSNPGAGLVAGTLAAPKTMISRDFVSEAAGVAAGFVLPNIILPRLPIAMRDTTWKAYASKVVVVAALAGASSLVNKRVSRALLLGGGVSILLDVWTDFVAPLIMRGGAAPAQGGAQAYYGDPGDPGVGAFYGDPGDPGTGVAEAYGGDGEAWG